MCPLPLKFPLNGFAPSPIGVQSIPERSMSTSSEKKSSAKSFPELTSLAIYASSFAEVILYGSDSVPLPSISCAAVPSQTLTGLWASRPSQETKISESNVNRVTMVLMFVSLN